MSMLTGWHLLAVVPPLLLIEGFFSGSEIALLSADKLALKSAARTSRRHALALELANHPERVLSSTLLMTSLCVITLSSLIAIWVIGLNVRHADLVAVVITSPLVVMFGELLPKTVYQRFADRLAPWVAWPVNAAYWAFYPITRVLSGYTTRLTRILGPIQEMLTGRKRTTRDELRSMLSYGKSETEITTTEKRMIKRIFDFRDSEAKHALIPLVKVEAIEDTALVNEAIDRFNSHRHSRMAVYSDRVDNIVGVVELTDLVACTDTKQPVRDYITPAQYVAETQSLESVMRGMRREDQEMVVVVDEYGGAVGILTFEDIVEEIVGEIQDEYDPAESEQLREIAPQRWLLPARTEIAVINEKLKLDLPEGEYETLGGFLLQQFGRIPELGDELYFDTSSGSLKLTVKKATDRAIESVMIERTGISARSPES